MAAQADTKIRTHNEYTIGWVCALPKEQTAATAMLDQKHDDLSKTPNDSNTYTLGSIGKHNIVIACLPKGKLGTSSAATGATQMVRTFPSIKIGLMVGIGGGIPPKVRLGNVVVSTPVGQFPGVVQWDFGKAKDYGKFERTGALNNPPTLLLTALTKLETQHEMIGSKIYQYLDDLERNWHNLVPKYTRPPFLKEPFFELNNSYHGQSRWQVIFLTLWETILAFLKFVLGWWAITPIDGEAEQVTSTIVDTAVNGKQSRPRDIQFHYGLIASGNQVIKDAKLRDSLNESLGGNVLCVEMEAAGLMDHFPCIVIRGICDYADSYKNKDWQEYAAAVAAAYAKELLSIVPPQEVEQMPSIQGLLDGISTDIKGIISRQKSQEHQTILDWLTDIDYGPQQSDYLKRRQEGTGQWLLDSTEYQKWLNTETQTLFCPGIPGAGKTILTSIVIDNLTTRFYNDLTIGIAFVYCDFRRQYEQKAEDLLSSILKQLAQGQSLLPYCVKALYDKHKDKRTRPSFDELSRTLSIVAAISSRVFIIIDALDECQESDNCRNKFLSEVFNLQAKTGASLFATSRFISEVADNFKGCLSLNILASDEDIRRYLNGHMLPRRAFLKDNSQLQDEIKIKITEATKGMFLFAQLYLDFLMTKMTEDGIRTELKKLLVGSEAYDQLYEKTMNRIEEQDEESKTLAKQVLGWITCSRRPLKAVELQCALAVEARKPNLNETRKYYIDDMVSVCYGLVTVDDESTVIRLIHYTTQQYFERTQDKWFPSAKANITTICVAYLSFNEFESGICQNDKEFEQRLRSNKLYDYASHNWGHHAREALTLCQGVIEFLQKKGQVQASSQALMAINRWQDYSQAIPKLMTGLHLAAYFGISDAARELLSTDSPDSKDSYGRTPLSYATENGHDGIVQLLLGKKADLEAKDNDGRTSLWWAAGNGHKAVVSLLLEQNYKDPNSKDTVFSMTPLARAANYGHEMVVEMLLANSSVDPDLEARGGRTPLWYAAINGHIKVVRLLIAKSVKLDSKDTDYRRTPLWLAAERGHEAVVECLLETNSIELNSTNKDGHTPFSIAVKNGHTTVVNLLLKNGVDLETKNKNGRTALSRAAVCGNEHTVQLLLDKGVEIESEDMYSHTPLSLATRNGHEAIVRLLLDKGAKIESKDMYRQTPLSLATQNGHEAIVRLLLDKGAEIESNDTYSQTPLSLAARNGHEATVRLLLEKGSHIESMDKDDRTPLLWATRNGHKAIVRLLLDKGAEIESKDMYSQTPLSLATQNGHEAIVRLLLDKGAEIESKDMYRQTPLSLAARNGHEATVRLLLEKGSHIESMDKDDRTPLLWATRNGHKAIVRLLLDKGVEIESKDMYSHTPLSLAARNGHEAIVRLLLDKGAEIESKDMYSQTPLSLATQNGHEAIVRLLLDKGAEIESNDTYSQTPLSLAAQNGHEATVQLLLEKGAHIGRTLLLWAARNGHEAIVRLLLDKGAEIESEDMYSHTPLSLAARNGHEAIVRLLLDKGAEIESKDMYRQTPLSLATQNGHEAIVRLLLDKGAEIESNDTYSQTPLSLAARNGHEATVQLLLEKGADIESKDENSRRPLSWAASSHGNWVAVKLLLEKGADIESKDKDSRTPLSWAASHGDWAAVKLLLEKGADIESKDENSRTPLSWAASHGDWAAVKLLLEKGADIESKDENSRTPLSWAASHGDWAAVKLLLEKGADISVASNISNTPIQYCITQYERYIRPRLI